MCFHALKFRSKLPKKHSRVRMLCFRGDHVHHLDEVGFIHSNSFPKCIMVWNIFVDRYAYIQHFSCCLVFWGFRPDTPWGPWKSTLFPDYIPVLLHEANTSDQAKAAPCSEFYTRCRGGDPVIYCSKLQLMTASCLAQHTCQKRFCSSCYYNMLYSTVTQSDTYQMSISL